MGRYDARGRRPVYVRRVARDFASGRCERVKPRIGPTQTARVRQELDAVRAARKGDEVDGSKLERGPIVLDDPKDDGDEKTIDSID